MRKKISSILIIIVCLAAFVFASGSVFACNGCSVSGNPYSDVVDNDWTILDMNVDIVVAKDRSAQITETLDVRYNVSGKHGIYRDLSVNSGEKYRDVSVTGADYSFERSGGLLSIRIGSEDLTYSSGSEMRYTIEYTLIPPKTGDVDEYYMNVIGFGYSTAIENATVTMTFPAAAELRDYMAGGYGETGGKDRVRVAQSEDGTAVTLTVDRLSPYEGVTVDAVLPDGTLRNYFDTEFLATLIVGVVLLLAAGALKMLKGRSAEIVPISNFYPPEENGKRLTPVQLGMLIDNACSDSDVTSMIFYWASKGYLELEEAGEDMKIIKKADLPADAAGYERTMFDKLFSLGDEVYTEQLKTRFYTAVSTVKSGVAAEYRGKLYDKTVKTLSGVLAVLSALYMVGMVLLAYMRISSKYFNVFGLISILPVAVVYAAGMYLSYNWVKLRRKRKPLLIGFIILAFVACGICALLPAADAMSVTEKILLTAFGALASCVAPFISRRTDYYTHMLGEVVGFRDFLTLAEKDKLEMMLEDNPQYYYDILPYANVLGVSDIWEDKFKDLTVEPPAYYRNPAGTVFTVMAFNSFYHRSSVSFRTAATTRPASSSKSGGGFRGGGGGFRGGGGFGGGGGRSW